MSLVRDLQIIACMARGARRGPTHAARLERFYRPQAGAYDDFRRRLLHGRCELYRRLPVPDNGVWIDMGGGTTDIAVFIDELADLMYMYPGDVERTLCRLAQMARQAQAEQPFAHACPEEIKGLVELFEIVGIGDQ